MSNNYLKIFATVWLCIVVSVLTVFTLCKLGATWFNMPASKSSSKSAQERMYDYCLEETNGKNTNNCNEVLKEQK